MKYIIMQRKVGELTFEYPIIFPNGLTHIDVAESIKGCPELNGAVVVSAGELSSLDIDADCYGNSFSLKIESRRKVDCDLIRNNDYLHGIVQ